MKPRKLFKKPFKKPPKPLRPKEHKKSRKNLSRQKPYRMRRYEEKNARDSVRLKTRPNPLRKLCGCDENDPIWDMEGSFYTST
jgi:hypothetical protein